MVEMTTTEQISSIVSGALYDLMGWLTTRRTEITLSDHHDAGIAVTTLIDFAKMRGLSLDNPAIENWQSDIFHSESTHSAEVQKLREELTESQRQLGYAQSQNHFDATRLRRLCSHFAVGAPESDEELLQVAGTVIGSVLRVAEQNRADDRQAGRDEVMKELSEMEPEGYKFAVWDGRRRIEVLAIDYIPQEHSVYGMEEIRGKDPLILRPTYKKG